MKMMQGNLICSIYNCKRVIIMKWYAFYIFESVEAETTYMRTQDSRLANLLNFRPDLFKHVTQLILPN